MPFHRVGQSGISNAELKGYSVAANTAVDLTDMVGGLYQAGTVIKAYSGTAARLSFTDGRGSPDADCSPGVPILTHGCHGSNGT